MVCTLGVIGVVKVNAAIDESTFKNFYPCFYQCNWETYDTDTKKELIKCLTVAYCQELEINPPIISFEDLDKDTYGQYTVNNNKVAFNSYYLYSAMDMYKTVAHESRHIWQSKQDEYADNFNNYISNSSNYSAYITQPIEMDARSYADTEYFKLVCFSQQ